MVFEIRYEILVVTAHAIEMRTLIFCTRKLFNVDIMKNSLV